MQPLIRLQRVIKGLLDKVDESLIIRGQTNSIKLDDSLGYIVVNSLSAAQARVRTKSFNGTGEVLTIGAGYRLPVTIDFYGENAYRSALDLQLLLKTDKAQHLQKMYRVALTSVSAVTDVKQLTGAKYINRYQLTLNLLYNESVAVDTLRIDEAVIDVNLNKTGI